MSKGRISERLRKRLNEGTMTPPSETVSEMRLLDVETEGLFDRCEMALSGDTDEHPSDAFDALRNRIRHLVSEARKEAIVEYLSDKTFTIGESQSFTDV